MSDLIQPGDVFVKKHGGREIIRLILFPIKTYGRGKWRYIHLTTGWGGSVFAFARRELTVMYGYRYVGTMPEDMVNHYLNEGTNGTTTQDSS